MEVQTGKKIFVKVDEYEGTYSITQGYHDKDGNFKPEMCLRRNYEKQDYTDKRGLSVYMGKGEEGRSNLVTLAMTIIGLYKEKSLEPKQTPLDDVPF